MKYNLANNEPLEINGDVYVKGVGTYDGTNAGESGVKTLKDILNSGVTEIIWSDLVNLRDNNELIPGQYYRITDYTCTTTQKGTKSAGHVFDIIVRADSENKLNEEASAIQHTGDEYFADCDLNAWRLWYCLDNDTTRFLWADGTNGKGVIYRMIDEWNNDVPYDFKNIMYNNGPDSWGYWAYTFNWQNDKSDDSCEDLSVAQFVHTNDVGGYSHTYSNVIKPCGDNSGVDYGFPFKLNACVFLNTESYDIGIYYGCHSNSFGNHCFNNSFGDSCQSNSFGDECTNNTFGNSCEYNSFGNYCNNNSFAYQCEYNSFGDNCYNNSFGGSCQSNSFGDNCYNNSFGNSCYYNSFEDSSTDNSFGNICYYNSFGNDCYSNSFGDDCNNNTFGDDCNNNTFESKCDRNSFGNNCDNNSFKYDCDNNSFGNDCFNNSFGNNCDNNSFGNDCDRNSFGDSCQSNSFGNFCQSNSFKYDCDDNSFGNSCFNNSFWSLCKCNTFGNGCDSNTFGSGYDSNTFGNDCNNNSFRVSASSTSTLKSYACYNHFDDGCSYNVIWNSDTTSSSVLLKNININRGVVGTSSSYNMINIDTLNSEQEINVNQVGGIVSIGNILSITYESLKTLRDSSKLIPGQQYRIIDYITGTSQENTQSAGHQFDIIVTALDECTLSEEAQAIQNINDSYFDNSNLSAWKIWYCLDNDTNRFAWAGDVKVGEIEHKKYDSSKCTINPELINGNAFITPFNFESCVWVDGNNDGLAYSDDHINHDISELVYEWGYFTDENNDIQLCLYKSEAGYYEVEGQPDYGDKYLYRGVVNVDGTEYDYWQKWDANYGGIEVNDYGDYVYATTQRIVSNPEAYSATIEIENIYQPGKGVIYRMIDEWNNDVPYDFKNIQYNGSWGYWAYTFNWINDESDNSCEDLSVAQYAHTNDEGGYSHTYGNVIKPCEDGSSGEYGYPLKLNACVFLNTESYDGGLFYGCYNNSLETDCSNNTFGGLCHNNVLGNDCDSNTFGDRCHNNVLGNGCSGITLRNDCENNTFGNYCGGITFGVSCMYNAFGNICGSITFGEGCYSNVLGNNCNHITFGDECSNNTFGNYCSNNTFGNYCSNNTFDNGCRYVKFASNSSTSSIKYSYYQHNHFGEGCQYILFKGTEPESNVQQVQNYNFSQGLQGTSSAYLTIEGVRNLSYEVKVAKNSKGEIKIYCEADLIA